MDDRRNILIVGKYEESFVKAELEAKSTCEIIGEIVDKSIKIKR